MLADRHWPRSSLQWRHNGRDGVSNHQPHDCLLNCLFSHRSKKTSKPRATGLFLRGIHRWPMNSPHKGPVRRKMFPFDDVIMYTDSRMGINCILPEQNYLIKMLCRYLLLNFTAKESTTTWIVNMIFRLNSFVAFIKVTALQAKQFITFDPIYITKFIYLFHRLWIGHILP